MNSLVEAVSDTSDTASDEVDLLWCAECGTTEADTYVVTFTGDQQQDPESRTEVCMPCHRKLSE